MTNVLTFNRGLSAVVSKELLSEITEIRNNLSKTLPWEPDIAEKFNKLARIAKTAQLRGIQRVLFACHAGAAKLATEAAEDVLTHTVGLVQALLNHLQDLVNDHKNTPMKLARPLQQLNQALGLSTSPMLAAEMYLPFLPEDTSAARPTEIALADFTAAVIEYRSSYQAGLIKLIKENDLSQLAGMRQTLVTLEPKNPHPGYRIFFEGAIAVFDCLTKTGHLDNASKWVVSKIDPELSLLAQGSTHVTEDFLSTVLYVVAKADPEAGARIRKLQDQFSLKSFVAEINSVDPAVIDKFLSVLVKARELWSTKQDLPYMLKITGDLQAKAVYLNNAGFTTTINALHEVLDTINTQKTPVAEEELSLEGASALLVLEQQLRDGSDIDLAKMSASRIYRLIGRDVDAGKIDKQAGTSILHQMAAEIQEDLIQLEPRLLEMLNEQTDGEADFRAGLVKIAKILRIFGKDNPLSLAVSTFEANLKIEKSADAKANIAAQYTQLGTLVEHLKTSEKTAMTAAQKWLNTMTPVDDSAANIPSENTDIPNDQEMLEIFLEEADGIVADLQKWIKSLKTDPSEHDTLVNARRGYHTLKGSGRMVGLSRFGDMSYITELLLNNWITSKKLASAELLQYLEDATSRVASNIKDFQTVGTSVVTYEDLETRAVGLGGMRLTDAPQSKKVKPSAPAPAPAPLPVVAPAPVVEKQAAPVVEAPVVQAPVVVEAAVEKAPEIEEIPSLTFEIAPAIIEEEPVHVSAPVKEVVVAQESISFETETIPTISFEETKAPSISFETVESPTVSFEDTTVPTQEVEEIEQPAPVGFDSMPTISFDIEPIAPAEPVRVPPVEFEVEPELTLDLSQIPEVTFDTEPDLVIPSADSLKFEAADALPDQSMMIPDLPPLEAIVIEKTAPAPSHYEEPVPALDDEEPAAPVTAIDFAPVEEYVPLEPLVEEKPVVLELPIPPEVVAESAQKRKQRSTPAAWQKTPDSKAASTPVRKEAPAGKAAASKPANAPSEKRPAATQKTTGKPAVKVSNKNVKASKKKKGAFAGFAAWLRGLFGGKK